MNVQSAISLVKGIYSLGEYDFHESETALKEILDSLLEVYDNNRGCDFTVLKTMILDCIKEFSKEHSDGTL